ncbi:hypothetical protein Y000_10820 [Staphylococcus aureus MUF168]|nr:hypothetical protein Y000_10820 [Staphylococcus aureus MUF168]
MIINLETQQIHFDLEHEIPYFQSPEKNRIRLDIDVLNKKQISNIINVIFNNQSKTKCTFLSEYLYPVKFREKNKNWSFFLILLTGTKKSILPMRSMLLQLLKI